MKVKYKLIIALALAVPMRLVAADELVINDYTPATGPGRVDTPWKSPATVAVTPLNFKDVTVVPPDLKEAIGEIPAPGARPRELPAPEEVAYSDAVRAY